MLRSGTDATRVAVTVTNEDLVVQVQPKNINVSSFRAQIQTRIPAYALPRQIMAVESLPMTVAEKLDYKMIGQEANLITTCHKVQHTSTAAFEQVIISAVRDVLGISSGTTIESYSNFLGLGTTSIHLFSLSQRLSKLLKRSIPIRLLLQSPTPQTLAQSLAHVQPSNLHDRNDQTHTLNENKVSFTEEYWWHRYQVDSVTSAFNINFVCELDGTINTLQLASAWDSILARHPILGSKFQRSQELVIRRLYNERSPTAKLVQTLDIDYETHQAFDLQEGGQSNLSCPLA
jgi:hypothetical protein